MDAYKRRERVYLKLRHGRTVLTRILDLVEIDGRKYAILSWVNRNGKVEPGAKIELDARLLKSAAPAGAWSYAETVEDPLDKGR